MIGKIVSIKNSIVYVQLAINIYQSDNLIGKNIWKAVDDLEKLGLQVEIQGNQGEIVLSQFPKPNVSISKNSIVMLNLESLT